MKIIEYASIIIRGSGKRAKKFFDELEELGKVCPDYYALIREKIVCVVDDDSSRWGRNFKSYTIRGKDVYEMIKEPILYVVAIADNDSVMAEVKKDTLGRNVTMCTSSFFLSDLYHEMLLCNGIISDSYDKIVRLSKAIDELEKDDSFYSSLLRLMNKVNANPAEAAKAIHFLYYDKPPMCIKDGLEREKKKERKGRLGIFLTCFWGGGAERVVSNLLPVYEEMGYDEVLFTDCISEKEYPMNENVRREIFVNPLNSNFNLVIDERYSALINNDISIACFHIPYEGYMLYYEVLLCYLIGITAVIENHTSFINSFVQRGNLLENLETYLLADHLVVLSRTDEVFWKVLGVNASFVLNPCTMDAIPNNDEKAALKEAHSLVWVGRIDEQYKRVFDLIPIIIEVKKHIKDIRLYLLGAAYNANELKQLLVCIEENGLGESIIVCGYQEDVSSFYERSSMLVMTSPGEGFGMVIAEAKSKGTPTVMYNIPYLELVKDGRGIITVNQGDTKAFAETVVRLLEDSRQLKRLSREAIESYKDLNNYDLKKAWRGVFYGEKQEIETEAYEKEIILIRQLLDENNAPISLRKQFVVRTQC